MEHIDTVIIGGGQAGMATSYWLRLAGHDHVVLERGSHPAPVWSDGRWDSFTMVTPNWSFKMPGLAYDGDSPDGFLPRAGVEAFFTNYARHFQLPIRYDSAVLAVDQTSKQRYRVETREGTIEADNVVVATGIFQSPKVPGFASRLSPSIGQVHTSAYRSPAALPPGAVLVVGSGMSACQIAEELYLSGRKVYLAISATGRAPRRYRGRDIIGWLDTVGFFDRTLDQMPPGSTRFDAIPHISGSAGGHTLNLHQFARDGVTLLGRMTGLDGTMSSFAPNLRENLARADGFEKMLTQTIDGYIQGHGLDIPAEDLPHLEDGFAQPVIEQLDLAAAGISTIVWGTGYAFDFSLVNLPVLDGDRFPIQDRGVTTFPGLYFAGLLWMPNQRSGFLIGIAEATRHIASSIANVSVAA